MIGDDNMKLTEEERIERIERLANEASRNYPVKEKRILEVENKCKEAIEKLDDILSKNDNEINKLGVRREHLVQIKREIKKMKQILNKEEYKPNYSRYLLDFQYADENLTDYLIEISSFYKKYT